MWEREEEQLPFTTLLPTHAAGAVMVHGVAIGCLEIRTSVRTSPGNMLREAVAQETVVNGEHDDESKPAPTVAPPSSEGIRSPNHALVEKR